MAASESIVPPPLTPTTEPPPVQALINSLGLEQHIEGGYYVQIDSSPTLIPSPYPTTPLSAKTLTLVGGHRRPDFDPAFRRLSTSIFYYLTPCRPVGIFHRNRGRIVHTWIRGRGRYVLIHPGGQVESFAVGPDVKAGERMSWVVEGGVWKASYLPTEDEQHRPSCDLLVFETVVPGFEYDDHEFLSRRRCAELLPPEAVREVEWLLKPES